MKKLVLMIAAAGMVGFAGGASAAPGDNMSKNSVRECGGTGLNQGQAWHLPGLIGGPAAGPDRTQTPNEFAELIMGHDSVGELLKADCVNVAPAGPPS